MPLLKILPHESPKDSASQAPRPGCRAAQGCAWPFGGIINRFKSISWDITSLADSNLRLRQFVGISDEGKKTKYPIRLLRYWFMHHFIHNEFLLKRRTVSVCEIGVDSGQMFQFMQAAVRGRRTVPEWSNWVAVDIELKEAALTAAGYENLVKADLEDPAFRLPKKYDVIILLHVLEHLREPEKAFRRLAAFVKNGGIIIGGFPSHPHWFASHWEKKLIKRARPGGHVSVFSPSRVSRMTEESRLKLEFLSGAFFMRHKGLLLENFAWWLRLNLLFGALFPSWPGEIYWMTRKPEPSTD